MKAKELVEISTQAEGDKIVSLTRGQIAAIVGDLEKYEHLAKKADFLESIHGAAPVIAECCEVLGIDINRWQEVPALVKTLAEENGRLLDHDYGLSDALRMFRKQSRSIEDQTKAFTFLRMIAYPKRGTPEQEMNIQSVAEDIQGAFRLEDLVMEGSDD